MIRGLTIVCWLEIARAAESDTGRERALRLVWADAAESFVRTDERR